MGDINIRKDNFLKNINEDKLTKVQKERFVYVTEKILDKLSLRFPNNKRRLSLSLMRANAEEEDRPKPKKKMASSPQKTKQNMCYQKIKAVIVNCRGQTKMNVS